MNTEENQSPVAGSACPICGSGSNNAFGFDGLCLRCAGVRVLELESGTPWAVDETPTPLERIGPYEIIEELGHGGMGRVYAARQPGLGRIVAVKAIREGVNPDLDLRFLREIQTVARLRHQNIVAVHESGRAAGSLYFSMDYIEGGDLATRLKHDPANPREAVFIMSKVADALAYAHEQGILHRDIKPSNILLDGKEPKLADFGLAAQIEAGGDLTAVTHILGTPHYLAPEAIIGGSAAQTVASDIYSVGVILFEMLTGRTSFAGASAAELPALVKEADAPSLRLLAPAVPRDLETVCLKCLERDPMRRYPNAAELAEDLRRFLANQPVRARPASALYRLRKFERRHRLVVVSAGLVLATLVAATGVSLWLAARARRAEQRAASESATSKAVVTFLEHDLLEQASPNLQPDRDIKLITVVGRAAEKVSARFKDQPEAEPGIRETLAQTYDSLGDYSAERPQLERAAKLSEELEGSENERDTQRQGCRSRCSYPGWGGLDEARKLLEHVISLEARTLGSGAQQTLHSTNDLVFVLSQAGKIQEAEVIAAQMVARCTKALGPLSDENILAAEANLSSMYFWEGRYDLAETTNKEVVAAYTEKLGPEDPITLVAMSNLAAVYANEDKMQEAQDMDEKLFDLRKRILGPEHPETLRTMNNLGAAYRANGRFELAEATNKASYQGRLKLYGPEHPDTLMAQSNLILAYVERGRLAEARALGTQGLESATRALAGSLRDPRHPLRSLGSRPAPRQSCRG